MNMRMDSLTGRNHQDGWRVVSTTRESGRCESGRRVRNLVQRGFTLIELLVVIAIIALLIGILLPALGAARAEGRAIKCAANLKSVGQAVMIYASTNSFFPAAYVYGANTEGGEWKLNQQLLSNPNPANGYVHWSWALFNEGGNLAEGAFTCPQVRNGGAPATNPGANAQDWEDGQLNDLGSGVGSITPKDRQARRIAYTGNAAIFPRNKFAVAAPRQDRFVNDATVQFQSTTILATEFAEVNNWRSVFVGDVSKSHRALAPFVGGSSGTDVYNEPPFGTSPRFFYPPTSAILKKNNLGNELIVDGNSLLNAVGRHHPGGGDAAYGGTANFVFLDGHVTRYTILETLRKRLWGDRFYSLTGNNQVDPAAVP